MISYALLAGDDALPDHEVDGPIRQGLRLGHESLQETSKHQSPITTCRTRETNKLHWPKQESKSRCGGRARGGGSCATTCAPRRGGRGRCLQMPSKFQHERSAVPGSLSPPLRLLPRTLAGYWCGGAVDCFVLLVLGCLFGFGSRSRVGGSKYEHFWTAAAEEAGDLS
jgi:hypothetical protein